jgi:dTDP-glucose 4,6-dehydratase
MLVLIYGAKGWIGSQVIEILKENFIDYVIGESRADDESVFFEICNVRPTHILSLLGRTHGVIGDKVYSTIDYLEEEGKLVENIRDNLYSPLNLALMCEDLNIHFTYMGTGCIFESENLENIKYSEGFTEKCEPNFFGSSYSIVKGFTDRIMKKLNVLNLRIRMPITDTKNSRNFITKITNYEKICSIQNSMSVLPELLPYMIDMMKNKKVGTYNFTNPGTISHNEILEMYREIVDPTFIWKNFSIQDQNLILSSKRSNNKLDTLKLEKLYPVKHIKDAVRDCLLKYPKPKCDFENNEDTNILITGGCGFIGSHFINYIWKKYDKIKIYNIDAMYYNSNKNNIEECVRKSERYVLFEKNINDIDINMLYDFNINYIVHFAAQSHVQNSFEEPLQYTFDNVLGTVKLLEVTRQYNKIKKFVHVSTDEVYGESILTEYDKKNEKSLLCPTNPYSGSKAGAELMCQTYISSFKMPIVITRGNNVFGKNQYPEKLIPKFIKHLVNNEQVTIQGDGSATRSFLYVDDTVRAFDIILCKGVIGEIYNIGTDDNMEYTVLDVAKILIKKLKNTEDYEKWISYIPDRPFNDQRYFICNNKLKNLGWKIKTDFITGIDIILEDVV